MSNSLCKEAKVTWGYVIFYYWLDHINIVSIEATCMDIAQLYLEKNVLHVLFILYSFRAQLAKKLYLQFIMAIRYTQSIAKKNEFHLEQRNTVQA